MLTNADDTLTASVWGLGDDPEEVLCAGYMVTDTAAGAMAVITRADLFHFLSRTATTINPSDGLRVNEKIVHVAPERPRALAKRPTAKEQVIQAAIASMVAIP